MSIREGLEGGRRSNGLLKESLSLSVDTKIIDDVKPQVGEADKNEFPEGGRGWLVVFGCMFISFSTFGMINSYGVFQTYYETELFPNVASSRLSIIGACQASLIYFTTPLAIPLVHAFGLRSVLTFGGCLTIIGLFALSSTSDADQLWKCYLFQAIMVSIGFGLLFPPVMMSPMEWFKERRAFALGLSQCGVGLGGTVWPIIFTNMIKKHGFQWTVRTIAFIYIPLVIGAVTFIPQQLPEQFVQKHHDTMSNSHFNLKKIEELPKTYATMFRNWLKVAKNPRYFCFLICNLTGMFGSYPAIFYLDYFANIINPGTTLTSYLLVIYNIMGAPGRIVPAFASDFVGRTNILFLCIFISGASILALWIPSIHNESMALYTVFVLIFGFTIGPFFSLFPATLGQLFGLVGSQSRVGLFLFTATPGPILGCLIAGSFIPTESDSKPIILNAYEKLTLYSGIMLIATSVILLIVRLTISKRPFVFL